MKYLIIVVHKFYFKYANNFGNDDHHKDYLDLGKTLTQEQLTIIIVTVIMQKIIRTVDWSEPKRCFKNELSTFINLCSS